MEHFQNAKVVRLISRHVKYLTADDDDEDGVRQHRSGASHAARWEVEVVEGRTDVIRLKSACFNRYLAASDKRFLLGATGRKVLLLPLPPKAKPESLGECVEWQPIRDGTRCVKFRTKAGTFLRANGFVKPYGNTVTHGNPHRTVTQDWVLWEVDIVDMVHSTTTSDPSSTPADGEDTPSPFLSFASYPAGALVRVGSMKDQFQSAGVSDAAKVLVAAASITSRHHTPTNSDVSLTSSCVSENDDCGYTPSARSVDSRAPRPTRLSTSSDNISSVSTRVALQSSFDSSSTVSSSPPPPARPPPPVRLRTPPSSPDSTSTASSSAPPSPGQPPPPIIFPVLSRRKSSSEGRLVNYYFADDDGEVDHGFEGGSFRFHGSTPQELINRVEEAAEVDNFILCTRSVIDDRLYRLSLNLPLTPNRAPMTVFIVHPNSRVAKRFR